MKAIILLENGSLASWLYDLLEKTDFAEVCVCSRVEDAGSILTEEEAYLFFLPDGIPGIPDRLADAMTALNDTWAWVLVTERQDPGAMRRAMSLRAAGAVTPTDTSEELRTSLEAAIRQLQEQQQNRLILDTFHQLRAAIIAQTMRGLLTHTRNERDFFYLAKLGMVPYLDRLGWVILIHVTNREDFQDLPRSFISMEVGSETKKLFSDLEEIQATSSLQTDVYVLFLQNKNGVEPEWQRIRERLIILKTNIEKVFGWQMTLYAAGPVRIRATPAKWVELEMCMRNNVSMSDGVYHLSEMTSGMQNYQHLQMYDLWRQLNQGQFDIAEAEAKQMLRSLEEAGQLSHTALHGFGEQFMQLVHAFMWEKNWKAEMLFSGEKEIELQTRAAGSVSGMADLIHHVMQFFRTQYIYSTPETVIQTVCRYISEHLEEPLHREELAAYVHLNPDYLSRIFRRNMRMSIKDYVIMTRLEAARRLLRGTRMRISEIAETVGYGNYAYFTHNYHQRFGITPLQERSGTNGKDTMEEKP